MRRFQTTPQKKLIGMLILFVFIPLFLLWYLIFFLDNRPDEVTMVILVCIALLGIYFYRKYRKQIEALAAGVAPVEKPVGEQDEEAEPVEEQAEEPELVEEQGEDTESEPVE